MTNICTHTTNKFQNRILYLLFGILSSFISASSPGDIVFTEFFARSNGEVPDYIEIYNTTENEINLQNWTLNVVNPQLLQTSFSIPAKSYAFFIGEFGYFSDSDGLVYLPENDPRRDESHDDYIEGFESAEVLENAYWLNFSNLSHASAIVELRDNINQVIDRIEYVGANDEDCADFCTEQGYSTEFKLDPDLENIMDQNNDGLNWGISQHQADILINSSPLIDGEGEQEFGSPGYANHTPINLDIMNGYEDGFTIIWANAYPEANIEEFKVYRNGTQIESLNSSQLQYTDTGLINNILYEYAVTAQNTEESALSNSIYLSIPTSIAGNDIQVNITHDGDPLTITSDIYSLDGSASFDLDGNALTFEWKYDDISIGNTSNYFGTLEGAGNHTIVLFVSDTFGSTHSDEVVITVDEEPNQAPTSNAGVDIQVEISHDGDSTTVESNEFTLLGQNSSDPEGDNLEYEWYFVGQLIGTSQTYSGTLTGAGDYVFTLVVTDPYGESHSDDVIVSVLEETNTNPIANAGEDFSIEIPHDSNPETITTDFFELNGLLSSDLDGDLLSYEWFFEGVSISSEVSYSGALEGVGDYIFTLKVTDTFEDSDSDDIIVTVLEEPNETPQVDAGNSQSVFEGTIVTLNGSVSDDDENYSIVWTNDFDGLEFEDSTVLTTSFVAPNVVMDNDVIEVSCTMTVTDPYGEVNSDFVIVTVTNINQPPEIVGQENISIAEDGNRLITLDDLIIEDSDSNPEDFELTLMDGENYTLVNDMVFPTEDYFGSISIPLVVSDGTNTSEIFNLQVSVFPVNDAPTIVSTPSTEATEDIQWMHQIEVEDVDDTEFMYELDEGPIDLIIDELGLITWTPIEGITTSGNIKVLVKDGGENDASPDSLEFEIMVVQVNDPPVSQDQIVITSINTSVDIVLFGEDIENDNLTFSIQSLPSNGTISGTPPNIAYNPNLDYVCNDTLIYKIIDDGLTDGQPDPQESDIAEVVITVGNCNNTQPVIVNSENLIVDEDSSILIELSNLVVEDIDSVWPDDFTLIVNEGENYSVDDNTVYPSENFNGILLVDIQVDDGQPINSLSESTLLSLTVNPINDAPVIEPIEDQFISEDSSFEYTLIGNDVDGDELEYSAEIDGNALIEIIENTLTIIPDENWTGMIQVSVTVSDSEFVNETSFELTVNPSNDAPIIISQEVLSVDEDNTLTINLLDLDVTDVDNVFPNDHELVILEGENYTFSELDITPIQDYNGELIVNIEVNDGTLSSEVFELMIEVVPVNDAPILSELPDDSIIEDNVYEIVLVADDVENDELIFSGGVDGNSTLEIEGQLLRITPNLDFTGDILVSVSVSDSDLEDSDNFVLTVLEGNDPPEIDTMLDAIIDEDTFYEVELSASDPDSENLIFTANIDGNSLVTIEGSHLTITPDENWNGDILVTVNVSDGDLEDQGEFIITVNAVNDPPVLTDLNDDTIFEDNIYEVELNADDVENDELIFSGGVDGNANLEIIGDLLRVTPNLDYTGDILVSVSVSDSEYEDSDDFILTVLEGNDPPVLGELFDADIDEDTVFEIDLSATDPDSEDLVFSAGIDGNGIVLVEGTHLTITPNEHWNGEIIVSVIVTDWLLEDTQEFILTVNSINDPPVLEPIPDQSIDEDDVFDYVIIVNDPDDEDLEIIGGVVGNATLEIDDNVLTILPNLDWYGEVIVNLSVSDGEYIDQDEFILTVLTINDAPVIEPIEDQFISEDSSFEYTLIGNDVDGDNIEFSAIVDGNSSVEIISNNLIITPDANYFGEIVVTVFADDGQGRDICSESFVLNVEAENDPPVINQVEDQIIIEDSYLQYSFSSYDEEDDYLTYSVNILEGNASSEIENSTAIFTPDPDWNGQINVEVIVKDQFSSDTTTFFVTVTPINDYPIFSLSDIGISVDEDNPNFINVYSIVDYIPQDEINQNVQYSISPETSHLTSIDLSEDLGIVNFVVDENANGTQVFTITADDGEGEFNLYSQEFTLTINPVNDPPELISIELANGLTSVQEDSTQIELEIIYDDIDSDPVLNESPFDLRDLTWSYSSQYETSLTLDSEGIFKIDSLQSNWNGKDSIIVIVSDGRNLSDSLVFELIVDAMNDPIEIIEASFENNISSIPEDTTGVSFTVLIEDVDSNPEINMQAEDPLNNFELIWEAEDTEQIYISQLNQLENGEGNILTQYFQIDSLLSNWNGLDTLNLIVFDNNSSDTIDFPIHVFGVNDPPVIDTVYFEHNISFMYEDTTDVGFIIDIIDVDSDVSLNMDIENPLANVINYSWTIEESEYIFISELNIDNNEDSNLYKYFIIDSLLENWNGFDTIQFILDDNEYSDAIDFPIFVEQVNDAPTIDSVYFENHISWIPEDTSNVLFHVEYRDVDMNISLNYDPLSNSETAVWNIVDTDQIQTDSLDIVLVSEDIVLRNYSISSLLKNWNGYDTLKIDVQEEGYSDSINFPIYIKQRNDSLIKPFEVIPDYISYNLDSTTFHYEELENTKLFYRLPKDGDNNSILEPLPLQLKWSREELLDIDTDSALNNDTLLTLFYRLELTADEYNYIVVKDSIEDNKFSSKDSVTVNIDFPQEFTGYIIDYYVPDSSNGAVYVDISGLTEYSWRVTAMNYWTDDLDNDPEYISNSDTLDFFIDLQEPKIDYSILQNEIYKEYYDVYMFSNESIIEDSTELIIENNIDGIINQEYDLPIVSNSHIYNITTSFPDVGIFEYNFDAWDHARNNFNSKQSVTFQYITPQELTRFVSPSGFASVELQTNSDSPILLYENKMDDTSLDRSNQTQVSPSVHVLLDNDELIGTPIIEFDISEFKNSETPYWQYQIMQYNMGEWSGLQTQYTENILRANVSSLGEFSVWVNFDLTELLPDEFSITPAYPNPFNPSINIPYSLPSDGNVEILVYNILGQKVTTLFNSFQTAGYKQIMWNTESATSISSGVYFVQIQFNNTSLTQKIMLLK